MDFTEKRHREVPRGREPWSPEQDTSWSWSLKAKVSGLFPEWQVRSQELGKPLHDSFHTEPSWLSREVGVTTHSTGEETEAPCGGRPGMGRAGGRTATRFLTPR